MSKLLSEWNTHVLEKEHHVLEKEHVSHEVSQKTTEIITQIRDLSYYPPFAFLSLLALQGPCTTGYLFKLVEVFVN